MTISKKDFGLLGAEWKSLNEEYDSLIQSFFDNPIFSATEKITALKDMQRRLFALETQLFEIIQGEVVIED